MKTMRKNIEMIASFEQGTITPIRFRFLNENQGTEVIQIDKVVKQELDRWAGNQMYTFQCQAIIGTDTKTLEVRYERDTCKWYLYKI